MKIYFDLKDYQESKNLSFTFFEENEDIPLFFYPFIFLAKPLIFLSCFKVRK